MTIHLHQKQVKSTHIFVDNNIPATNSRFELVCDLVELPFRIIFSAKPKIERLRTTHHLKAAGR
jgi:hypothetical protein